MKSFLTKLAVVLCLVSFTAGTFAEKAETNQPVKKEQLKKDAKLVDMNFSGKIITQIRQRKGGKTATYYKLQFEDGSTMQLANQKRGKKKYNAPKIDLAEYVDKNVKLDVKATTRQGKTKEIIKIKAIMKITNA